MSTPFPDTLFTRLFGELGTERLRPKDPRLGVVGRAIMLTGALIGMPMLFLQILQILGRHGNPLPQRLLDYLAVALVASTALMCFWQYLRKNLIRWQSSFLGVSLVVMTILTDVMGVSSRFPAAPYSPMVVYLLTVFGLAVRTRWGYLFALFIAVMIPWLSAEPDWITALCVGIGLACHGTGVIYVARATRVQEEHVSLAAYKAREATVKVHDESVEFLERAHWEGLVHDHVINVLRSGVRSQGNDVPWLRAEAHRALALLQEAPSLSGVVSGQEVERRLGAVVQGIAPDAQIDSEEYDSGARFEAPVVSAVVSAVGESLRNAVQHSKASSILLVTRITRGRLSVVVADDGVGFDPSLIRPGAMGIRGSIQGRMERKGCSCEIRSTPGEGTFVLLEWEESA